MSRVSNFSLIMIIVILSIALIGILLEYNVQKTNKEKHRANYNKIIEKYKVLENSTIEFYNTITENKRLYQHFIAEVFNQKNINMSDENIVLFLKLSECDNPDINFCTAKHETGNGGAGSGTKYMQYKGNKVLSNGHHGMKSANTFFHWNEKLITRNKQSYKHWTYSYLTMDERLKLFNTWQKDWFIYKPYYDKIASKIIIPKSRIQKINYINLNKNSK